MAPKNQLYHEMEVFFLFFFSLFFFLSGSAESVKAAGLNSQ